MTRFFLFSLLIFSVYLNAQITHDNNTINSNSNPLSITVPPGNNKALIVIPLGGNPSDFTFDPFNGVSELALKDFQSLTVFIFLLGDVFTEFTTDLSYAEPGKDLTVFSINNVDQIDSLVQATESLTLEYAVNHHGGFEKKPGDMAIAVFRTEFYASAFNATPFTVVNSENNPIKNEFQFLTTNEGFPYFAHYSSIITDTNEYTTYFLDDPLPGIANNFAIYKIGVIVRSVDDVTLSSFEENTNLFKIFPNPTQSILKFSQPIDGTFNIYNNLGQNVLYSLKSQSILQIDISALSTGSYIIKLKTTDGKSYQKQFIID